MTELHHRQGGARTVAKPNSENIALPFEAYYRAVMRIRDTMREAFVQAGLRSEHTISWRLRVGYIEQLAEDTERVLGYKPKNLTSFLGLPIEVRPFGSPNELVTSVGPVALPLMPVVETV